MEVEEYISRMNTVMGLFQKGALQETLDECNELIRLKPERKGAYLLKVQILSKQERLKEAERVLMDGLDKTNELIFHSSLGIIRSKMGEHEKALESFDQVMEARGKNVKFYFYLAKSLAETGRAEEAIVQYTKCLNIQPEHKSTLNNLANLYQKLGDKEEAIAHYQKLIKLHPEEAVAHCNLGSLYEKQNQLKEARRCYENSLKLDPSLSITYFNLAQLLGAYLNDFTSALSLLGKGLKLGDSSYRKGLRFYQIVYRKHVADWSDYDEDVKELNQILEEYLSEDSKLPFDIVPYTLSYSKIDNQFYRRIAERYAKNLEDRVKLKYPTVTYDRTLSQGKIKIGYYSPNFRLHPGGVLVRKLFDYHDAKRFEVHAFSLVDTDDFVSKDIKDTVDYYHDVSKLSSVEIADLINRTGIDILVSLAFYNTSMNLEVLALRPAPIQMVLIGSHETTGASFIDYAFSDAFIMDKEIRGNFSEKMITLPCSLLLNSELPVDESIRTTKAEHGLPEDQFIYASFNHPRKLDPETFDAWIEILKEVPNSVLWLYDGGSEEVRKVIKERALSEGLKGKRVIFAESVDIKKHWERLRHADLFLDSFLYNAHVTGIEALRMGVPMISLKGTSHNSRLGCSLLHYSGLKNCTILDKNDYIQGAISIATENSEMMTLRKKMSSTADTLLFDTEIQVKFLEVAYRKALLKYRKGDPPRDFSVNSALELDSLNMNI